MIPSCNSQTHTRLIYGSRSHNGGESLQGLSLRGYLSTHFYTMFWIYLLCKDLSSCTLEMCEFTVRKLHLISYVFT